MNKKDDLNYKRQYNDVLSRINRAMQHFDAVGVCNVKREHFELFINLIRQSEIILMMYPEATAREILFGFSII